MMKKKKVLLYIGNFDIGGAQNMVYELAKKLTAYDVEILCHSKKTGNSLEEKAEKICKVTYLNCEGKTTVKSVCKALKAISAAHPDVVHCHLGVIYIGVLWCKLHRKKCVVTAHTKPERAFNSQNEKFLRYGMKKGMTALVAVSKENQALCKIYYGTEKIECVNNGIDISAYAEKPHEIFTFLHVARQDKNKNAAFILDCFKRLLDEGVQAKLVLLGDGEEHQNLIERMEKLSIADFVEIPGNVGNTNDYYALSDCFLLASHREALPMTGIEALATGIPIVSTDVGGLKDLVKGNGFLVPDGDFEGYCEAMKKAMKLDRTAVEAVSFELVKEFSSEKMAAEYERIYENE